jgi:polysaccharide export outer membrane protein
MVFFRILTAMVLLAGMAGCSTTQPRTQAPATTTISGPYRLDTGDRVRVTVFEQPSLSDTFAVDQSGYIAMPLIGQVPARGRSTVQLRRTITERLAARYLRDPDITVEVSEYRPFFVHGAVKSAGQYPYLPGMTAETAIAVAGGLTVRAPPHNVRISRTLNGTLHEGYIALSEPIRPGDTIFVPNRSFR